MRKAYGHSFDHWNSRYQWCFQNKHDASSTPVNDSNNTCRSWFGILACKLRLECIPNFALKTSLISM